MRPALPPELHRPMRETEGTHGTGGLLRCGFIPYLLLTSGLLLFLVLTGAAAEAIPNSACMDCHADKTLYKTNAAGVGISLFVEESKMARTVHHTNTCASCHSDISSKHPDDNLVPKPVNCASCHEEPAKAYATSIHGASHALGASG